MSNVKVLFLAANPVGPKTLRLDEEAREIETKIRAAEHRDAIEWITKWAVRPDDLLQVFNQHKPHVVHYSGHANKAEEIILLDNQGNAKPVSKPALVSLFRTMKGNIRLVLLNACFSQAQAEAITDEIDCVVGMKRAIGDQAAIVFAASFYRAIGFGCSVKEAFEQGRTALLLERIAEENTPELLVRTGVDPSTVVLITPPSLAGQGTPKAPGRKGDAESLEAFRQQLTTDQHSIRFAVDCWKVWREPDDRQGHSLGCVSAWPRGEIRFSCTIRLRNELEWEEQLHRLWIEFRRGEEMLLSDESAFHGREVILPPKKWVSLEVDSGIRDRQVFERSDCVWLTAETVGNNVKHEWRLATLECQVDELPET